jgi:flagellar biosynthetic protein FliQ
MTPDMVAELLRQLMKESMILAAPVLIAAALLSFL